ncbi:hypothetical protein B0H15DRAFT_855563 [Mycena belliarum]|uniref:NmrA-like domain-containing protein n=1 Tax=Mycena belliarum TaxID=1033014 RepID=A0AAD6TYQ0_9AGAR|nr:hypothetical protein B0H15DRAFT_855563 [Mycena belliae]
MSVPRNIAIFGASGTLGPFLLQAFATHPKASELDVRILTRHKSTERAQALAARHPTLKVTVHAVNFAAANAEDLETGLEEALRGVDVVISAVGDDSGLTSKDVKHTGLLPGFIAQDQVARAAKAAGVKLFLPSEYGTPTHSMAPHSDNYVVGKRLHHDFLRSLELPCLLVYSGMFPATEPAPTPLPASTAAEPPPLGEPPFETTRYHLATYIVQLLLDRGAEVMGGGIYALRGLRRDKILVADGKTQWILDA